MTNRPIADDSGRATALFVRHLEESSMKIRLIASLLLVLLFTPRTFAGIRPSFNLDYCTWQATHIVVATEGDEIDGILTVLDSWKGDLRPGEQISIPELDAFKSLSSRELKDGIYGDKSHEPKKYVSGLRMILFLKQKERSAETAPAARRDTPVDHQWEPASTSGITWSVVWIEGGEPFAFMQIMNPGPSLLTSYDESEQKLRERAFEVTQIRQEVNEVVAIKDQSRRAESLEPFTTSGLYYARDLAFAELQKCGPAALPVLRRMLKDPTLLNLHGSVIKALTSVGGEKVADELTALVKDELEFWKVTGPRLNNEWWNGGEDAARREMLRDRYGKVLEALYSLRKLRAVGCKDVVTEFRDFWRSLPQLEDKRGLTQMSEECDKILSELR